MQIKSAKDLILYQKAYALAMVVFEISKRFPQKRNTRLPIKFDAHRGPFALISVKHGPSEDTKPILSANYPMRTARIAKLTLGSILPVAARICRNLIRR
jgi:hypothetical protein